MLGIFFSVLLVAATCLGGINYNHSYSWGRIKDRNNLCLQEYYGHLEFRECDFHVKEQYWMITGNGNFRHRNGDDVGDQCIDIPTESSGRANTKLHMQKCSQSSSMEWHFAHTSEKSEQKLLLKSGWQKAQNMCLSSVGKNQAVEIRLCSDEQYLLLDALDSRILGFDAFPHAALDVNGITYENWMNDIFHNTAHTRLQNIIIPGTHNSGTYSDFTSASKTQAMTVGEQLKAGARYLDVRVDVRKKKGLVIVHGIEDGLSGSVRKVFSDIKTFAVSHPKEIIIVDLQNIPNINDDKDSDGKTNVKILGDYIFEYFSEQSFKSTISPMYLEFYDLWSINKNIILLVADYEKFIANAIVAKDLVHNRNELPHRWPNSSDFRVIALANENELWRRPMWWHMAQVIRTPSNMDSFFKSVEKLHTEETRDGRFNYSVGKWLNSWIREGLRVNFIETDFIEQTSLVPMALWHNLNLSRQTP